MAVTDEPLLIDPGPDFAQFQWWVANIMAVPSDAMPDVSVLQWCYNQALNMCLDLLQLIPCQPNTTTIYANAVYNLAGHILCESAPDQPPSTYWTDLRTRLGVNNFVYGLIQSASDQGTSQGMMIPESLQGLTLGDLALTQTPWGQRYLQIAQYWGSVWGIT